MATEIRMPQLSDTMDAGKILTWLKREGEMVKRGDILAEVETDKANLQIEAFQQGVLLKIVVPATQSAKVGEIIAVVGQAGEQVDSSARPSAGTTNASSPPNSPTASAPTAPVAASTPVKATSPNALPHTNGRIKASPLAKRLAEQQRIDLSQLRGSGPHGRIIKRDIETLQSSAPASTLAAAPRETGPAHSTNAPTPAQTEAPRTGSLAPLSKMRETIARRMQESVRENPHFYVTASINMQRASSLRERLKEIPDYKGISINHLVVKASAYALQQEPRVNRAMKEGQIYTPGGINIGIITAVEDGILIPIVKDADRLSLKDIVFEAKAAVDRARAGRPNATDLSGGTFSISNMGMFDVENFTAIINPGQGAVLAVSSMKEEPVVENHALSIGLRMKVTLSVDHRIIDGVMAGTWLKHFKAALEEPTLMFL